MQLQLKYYVIFFFKEKARFLFICFDRQFAYRSMTKAEDALEV